MNTHEQQIKSGGRSTAKGYAIAVGTVAAALLTRLLLDPLTGQNMPMLMFTLPVIVSAWYGGFGPGLFATMLSVVAGALFLVEPHFALDLTQAHDLVRIPLFVLIGIVISALNESLNRARLTAEASRKQAEEHLAALAATERRFRLIVDGVQDYVVALLDPEGRIVSWNAAAERITGYRAEEVLSQHISRFYTVEDVEEFRPELGLQAAQEHGRWEDQGWRVRKDGSLFWANTVITTLRDDRGALRGFVEISRDITEQRRDEEAMQRSISEIELVNQELRYQHGLTNTIASNAAEALFLLDGEGRVTFVNPAAEQAFGWSREELLGKVLHDVIHCEHPDGRPFPSSQCPLANVFRTGQTLREHEDVFLHKNGRQVPVACSNAPILDPLNSKVAGAVLVAHDITDRKRYEQELRESKEAAERANQAKDHFMAVLSHELRTPLTPALALASVLESEARLPEDVREDLGVIRRNIELEARLVDDLLDVSSSAACKLNLRKENTDAHDALMNAVEVCQKDIDHKGLTVRLEMNAEHSRIWADPIRFRQAAWNLVRNAVKFTPSGGQITIQTLDDGDEIVINVIDTGIGISPENLSKIFRAFEQGEAGVTRQYGGLGLGLTISRALIVDGHGGELTAYSEGSGKGATFTVRMKTTADVSDGGAPVRSPEKPDAERGHGLRVLLVEDHDDTCRVMSRLLRSSGYHVTSAGTVHDALRAAEREDFQLLISDIGLPDGSGWELMRQIRQRFQQIGGIALSGYGMEDDRRKSTDAGFQAHLTKPVDLRKLEQTIHELSAALARRA